MVTQLTVIQGDPQQDTPSSRRTGLLDNLQSQYNTGSGQNHAGLIRGHIHTLTRRDSYLDYIKSGIKQDTLTALRTAPLHMSALFPDHLISKAEEEICHHEDKRTASSSHKGSQHFLTTRLADSNQILTGKLVPRLGNS